jgi:hypothetical protein
MVIVRRDRASQHDICSDRHADLGSSCSTLFCAQLAVRVLTAESESKQEESLMMDNVQALLWMCVKEWDRMNQDGAHPRDTLESVCAREGLDVKILVDDEACTMSSLEQRMASVSEGAAPSQFGAAITGIPRQGGQVGDTFLLLRLPRRVVVVDSHRHSCEGATGTVIAESQTVMDMVKWIFRVLLEELSCSLEYVSVTVFVLKATPLSSNISLADFARQSIGKARKELQGSQPQQLRQGSQAQQPKQTAPSGAASNPRVGTDVACGSQPEPLRPVQCGVLNAVASHTCTKFSAKCAECQAEAWQTQRAKE